MQVFKTCLYVKMPFPQDLASREEHTGWFNADCGHNGIVLKIQEVFLCTMLINIEQDMETFNAIHNLSFPASILLP